MKQSRSILSEPTEVLAKAGELMDRRAMSRTAAARVAIGAERGARLSLIRKHAIT